jgi:hypothetical protein
MASVQVAKPENVGVINPFALVEIKLKRIVDWSRVADHRKFLETVLGFPYDKLFDPQHGSPLYAGLRYDRKKKILTRDESIPDLPTLLSRIRENDLLALQAGAAGGTSQHPCQPELESISKRQPDRRTSHRN